MSNKMRSFLNTAVKIAATTDNPYRHGAVLVKGGRVISYAPNIFKNRAQLFSAMYPHDVDAQKESIKQHCSEHAEARVVKMAGENARGSIIYVARVDKHGKTQMSRPCDKCYAAMVNAGVKAVVYTEGDADREYRLTEDIELSREMYEQAA